MVFEVAVLDMAGTTVRDEGLVEAAFVAAIQTVGVDPSSPRMSPMLEYVRATMGQSKIEVFEHLVGADLAAAANAAFEREYARQVADAGVEPVPGAATSITRLRDAGIRVALTTGFAPDTQTILVEALGWADLVDLWLAPAQAGRGRPHPDLPLTALLRLRGSAVRALVVVGDTAADMGSGVNAGAGAVVGVLSGAHDEPTLRQAGATDVIASVAQLPDLLGV